MKKVVISGRSMPAIGIGTWHMGNSNSLRKQEIEAIRTGIENGLQLIDTAEMYGNGKSELLVGEAIKPYNRDQLYIVDKVLPSNASHARLERSLDSSLKKVGVDYFDLYLYHWRGGVTLEETIFELNRMVLKGKIKAWGVSNFDVDDMEELLTVPHGKDCADNEDLYNIGNRGIDFDLIEWQRQHNIPLIAYSPVSQGDSLGKNLTTNEVIMEIAQNHGITPYQVLLAWAIRNPQTIAIPQTSNPKHMLDNVKAASLELTSEDLTLIDKEFPKPKKKKYLEML